MTGNLQSQKGAIFLELRPAERRVEARRQKHANGGVGEEPHFGLAERVAEAHRFAVHRAGLYCDYSYMYMYM